MTDGTTFWARRRAGIQAEARSDALMDNQQAQDAVNTAAEDKTDAEVLAELNLPDPETLTIGDDFSAFMSKAVPDRLRRRALRVLWRSNPVLANVDALVDYGEDYTDSAMVVENMQTAYQVGKGMMAHIEKLAADAEAKAKGETQPEELEQDEELVLADAPPATQDNTSWMPTAALPASDVQNDLPDHESLEPPAPRRMAFTFETGSP